MALSPLFAIRGFLAFVAFMEFVNAFRSLFPSFFTLPHERLANSFIHNKIFSGAELNEQSELIIAQLFGFYSFLNGCVLVQTAVFCHLNPIVVLGILILFSKAIFYILQGFIYGTIAQTSGLQVPLLITLMALVGLCFLPWLTTEGRTTLFQSGSENDDILKQMTMPKRKRKDL